MAEAKAAVSLPFIRSAIGQLKRQGHAMRLRANNSGLLAARRHASLGDSSLAAHGRAKQRNVSGAAMTFPTAVLFRAGQAAIWAPVSTATDAGKRYKGALGINWLNAARTRSKWDSRGPSPPCASGYHGDGDRLSGHADADWEISSW